MCPNFEEHTRVENVQASESPTTSFNQKELASYHFVWYPSRILLKAEQTLTIPQIAILNILRNRFHMFPYKISVNQQHEDRDYTAQTEFSNWWLQNIRAVRTFVDPVNYSHKCFLHVDGKVSEHSAIIWGTESPQDRKERSRESRTVDVCCAMSVNQVFSQYCFASSLVTVAN